MVGEAEVAECALGAWRGWGDMKMISWVIAALLIPNFALAAGGGDQVLCKRVDCSRFKKIEKLGSIKSNIIYVAAAKEDFRLKHAKFHNNIDEKLPSNFLTGNEYIIIINNKIINVIYAGLAAEMYKSSGYDVYIDSGKTFKNDPEDCRPSPYSKNNKVISIDVYPGGDDIYETEYIWYYDGKWKVTGCAD